MALRSLQLGLWEGCFYGLREALEAIDNGDQDVSDTRIAEIVQHLSLELGAHVRLKPKVQ